MTTALDIIKRSLRLLGVLASGEAPTAAEEHDALVFLNGIMSSLLADTDTPHVDYNSNSALTSDQKYDEALAMVLAEKIAPEYTKKFSASGVYGQLIVGIRGVNSVKFDRAMTFNTSGEC